MRSAVERSVFTTWPGPDANPYLVPLSRKLRAEVEALELAAVEIDRELPESAGDPAPAAPDASACRRRDRRTYGRRFRDC